MDSGYNTDWCSIPSDAVLVVVTSCVDLVASSIYERIISQNHKLILIVCSSIPESLPGNGAGECNMLGTVPL